MQGVSPSLESPLFMSPEQFQLCSRARRIAGLAAAATLFACFFLASLRLAALEGTRFWLQSEAGYGDSYILYDVDHFKKTGVIYRDLSKPPYLPAQYSPLVYMMYAIPGENSAGNPFIGPRVVALIAFLSCVAIVLSLVRALVPLRFAWLWGLVLLGSIRSLEQWPLQLRGDFPAIFFNLAGIRLLMSRWRYRAAFAGLCAGAALQFKFTYVAGIAAGFLWLALRRRWKELAHFVAAAAVTSAGIYALLWLREPAMASQMFALAPGIADFSGLLKLILQVVNEPMLLLVLPALPALLSSRQPRWLLLFLFALLSFILQGAADVQAGGNVNYFFEGLFALIPAAVLGTFQLISWSRARVGLAAFVTGLFLIHLIGPQLIELYRNRSAIGPRAVESNNQEFRRIADVLRGRHMLSFAPRLALLDPQPALVEPYLMSYMERLGKFDATPLLERIANREFELVIAKDIDSSWRGVPLMPDVMGPIETAYRRQCSMPGLFVYLPRDRAPDRALIQGLTNLGCTAK
jgi:hypothetical protein